MERRTTVMGAGLLGVAALAASAIFMLQPSAQDILTNAAESMDGVESGHAVVSMTVDTPEKDGTATVEFWGYAPAEGDEAPPVFRMEVLESTMGDEAGSITVSDGVNIWAYDPAENLVVTGTWEEMKAQAEARRSEMDEMDEDAMRERFGEFMPEGFEDFEEPQNAAEAVELMLEYFTADKDGSEELATGAAWKLRLVPIAEKLPEQFAMVGGVGYLWVDKATNAPVQFAFNGSALGEAQGVVERFELNPELDPALFTFEIPAGAEVKSFAEVAEEMQPEELDLSAAADLGVKTPAVLPEGATLVEVLDLRGTIAQRYSLPDGGWFSVAQGPAEADVPLPGGEPQLVDVNGLTAELYADEDGSRVMLTWVDGDLQFWVGGDVTADEALATAQSLN